MSLLGALEIQMYADLARLRQDMNQAKGVVNDAAKSIQGTINTVGSAFQALGVGLSGAAFTAWIKGAIDAADEASKLAQKMGVTTEKVAGLQLAFQQSGAGGPEVMQKAMVRLSAGLVEGNKTLEALGIRSRDARDALALIADQFQAMPNGVEKTALAVGIFGDKLGANMIPLLNAGSKGLAEMDKLAADLGLTIDTELGAAAESFNDHMEQVQKATQGVALSLAQGVLPALEATAREMAEASKHGGAFAGMSQALAVAFEALVVLGSDVAFVFRGIWREVSTIAGQAKALATEGLAAAAKVRESAMADARADRDRLDAFQRRILQAREIAELTRNAADLDEPRLRRAMEEGNRAIAARNMALGKTADEAKRAAAEQKRLAEAEADRISRRGLAQLKRYDDASAEDDRLTEAARKAQQAELELRAAQDLGRQRRVDQAEADAEKAYLAEVEAAKKAQDQILAEWQKTVDQMGQALADALMTGGKSVADYLKGLFRQLVLRPVLMPTATAMSSMISGPAGAMGGVTGGGGMGNVLNIGGALGGLGTFGAAAAGGATAVMSGAALGEVLTAAGAAAAQGTLAGVAAGAGLAVGAIAPYVAAAYAVYAVAKKGFSREYDWTHLEGTYQGGDFMGRNVDTYGGAWFRSDKNVARALEPEVESALDAGAKAVATRMKAYAEALGLPASAVDKASVSIRLATSRMSEDEIKKAIEKSIDDYTEAIARQYERLIKPLQKAGETLADTMERLVGLESASRVLSDLGGVFGRIATASVSAKEALAGMVGGLDNLVALSTQFVQDYYSRDEIAGVKADEVMSSLLKAGFSRQQIGALDERGDLRALMDSLDPNQDAAKIAAVLQAAKGFGDVADYLQERGTGNLGSTAAQSPGADYAGMFANSTTVAINGVGFWTEAVYRAIKELTGVVINRPISFTPSTAAPATEVTMPVSSGNWTLNPDGTLYDRN